MRHLGCSAFRFPRCGRGAKPRNRVRIHLTPARTRSEAEKQRQRWEKAVHPLASSLAPSFFSGQSLGVVSDPKLAFVVCRPLKRFRGMAHAHLKNPYMAFSYDDDYRKIPSHFGMQIPLFLRVVLFHVSTIKCF
jgi:hypothetical protein